MDEQPTIEGGSGSAPRPAARVEREIFRFGDFELRTNPDRLLKGGSPIPLQPQPAKALALLLERAGSVVTRDEIREHLWGDSFLEYDQGINFAIRKIRKSIEDDPAQARFIETIPKLGYRFIAPVRRGTPPANGRLTSPLKTTRTRRVAGWIAVALAAAATLWLVSTRRPTVQTDPVVAVLPLQVPNLPTDSVATLMGWSPVDSSNAGAALSAVLTEEWLVALTDTIGTRARVIAMDPAARGGSSDTSLAREASLLGAAVALRGQVTSSNGGLQVELRMLRTSDRVSVWAHRFDIAATSRAAVLRAAARDVQRALKLGGDPQAVVANSSVDDATYTLYLRGRYLVMSGANANDGARVEQGMALLKQATSEVPGFGRAHSALAHAHLMGLGLRADPADVTGATRHAQRALEADPSLAEAHVVLGAMEMYRNRDWSVARASFERAIALQPGLSKTYRLYGSFLSAMGEHGQAIGALRRAVELDPASSRALGALAEGYMLARDYPRALEAAAKAVEAGSFNSVAKTLRIHIRLLQGDDEGALVELGRLYGAGPRQTTISLDEWHRGWLEDLEAYDDDIDASHATQAVLYSLLGENGLALDALERAVSAPADLQLPYVAVDPRMDPLRNEARFVALVKRIGLSAG